MKQWAVAGILLVVSLLVYWPHAKAEFVLDDHYTIVRNPLIKNPALYGQIWASRLFDANLSSRYIKFGYYRPVLESSWIADYRLFGLKASGFQWGNLLIHGLNCFLIYILLSLLFVSNALAFGASLLFCVNPFGEWVVRYGTGRGDELSCLFALASLIFLLRVFKTGRKSGYIYVFVFWLLAALTREVACSYVLYAFLIYRFNSLPLRGEGKGRGIDRFCFWWIIIGISPLLVLWPLIPKLGNILSWHVLYFASVGLCLWLAQARPVKVGILAALFAAVSFYQGRFWTTEEALLRHTQSLEWWPHTVVSQQLLMKYDDDIPAIAKEASRASDQMIKAMWLRRLGTIYFSLGDASGAKRYFNEALAINPFDVDTLDAYAVVCLDKKEDLQGLNLLDRALGINPVYSDTLKKLGIYYYRHRNFNQARFFLSRCLFLDPDQPQVQELLRLARYQPLQGLR